jgi:hypothetical protein
MKRHEFDSAAEAAHRGEISFQVFAHRTKSYWDTGAKQYHQSWPLPPWFTIDDVRQVMLELAWQMLAKYNPRRHNSAGFFVRTYVRRNTVRSVLKVIGASTHRPKPGQKIWRDYIETPSRNHVTELGAQVDHKSIESKVDPYPTPDKLLEQEQTRARQYDIVRRFCDGEEEIVVVTALQKFRGDTHQSARAIAGSPELREVCGINNQREARRLIRNTLDRLAAEYGKQVA